MPYPPDKKERYFTYSDYLSWGDDIKCELMDGVIVTDNYPMKRKEGKYKYHDLKYWDDEVRYEMIDGVAYALHSPLPNHQDIARELTLIIGNYLKNKPYKLYYAPYCVRLNADTKDDTVFYPDIVVISDLSKQDKHSYKGAPALVIEITAPPTALQDRYDKYEKYLEAKVPEYWIVELEKKMINMFVLENGQYNQITYRENEKVKSTILVDCVIDLKEVFPPEEGI